ncbi:MAG: cyclic nucleotide-binding domain-containing protein [Nitrospinota bacterium]
MLKERHVRITAMDIDPQRKKVVFIMKRHQKCPIFTECGTMVIHWPMLNLTESSGCCAEALSSFLPQARNPVQFSGNEFECSLETCRGYWVMSEEENMPPQKDASVGVPVPGSRKGTVAKAQIREPFLASVPPFIAGSLVQLAKTIEYEKGEVVLEQGVQTGIFFVLKKGAVEIIRLETGTDGDSDEAIVGELGEGECFGEMSLLTGDPTSACVRAKLPSTILAVEEDDFYALMHLHPEFSIYLTQLLADRIRSSNMRLRQVLEEGMVGRIGMVPIFDLVQNLHQSRRSGMVEMRQGAIHGGFGLARGKVIFAFSNTLEGEEAFYNLCEWKKGTFAFYHERVPPRKNISLDTMPMLLEAMLKIDEKEKE